MNKRIGRSSIIGEQGIAYIRRTVLDMGHMFYETGGVEAGIDGYIELRDQETGQVGNLILQVQGKATERERLPAETPDSFEWPCTKADIRYWRQGTAPVLLVVVQTKTNRAYWKSVRDYFPNADAMQRRSIVFDKRNDVFNASARAAISAVAASAKPGAITPPTRVTEELVSNLHFHRAVRFETLSRTDGLQGQQTIRCSFSLAYRICTGRVDCKERPGPVVS